MILLNSQEAFGRMTNNDMSNLDPQLKEDLKDVIKNVDNFLYERDTVMLSLLRQMKLPELYERCDN